MPTGEGNRPDLAQKVKRIHPFGEKVILKFYETLLNFIPLAYGFAEGALTRLTF